MGGGNTGLSGLVGTQGMGSGLGRFGAGASGVPRVNYTPQNYSAPSVTGWTPSASMFAQAMPPAPAPVQGPFANLGPQYNPRTGFNVNGSGQRPGEGYGVGTGSGIGGSTGEGIGSIGGGDGAVGGDGSNGSATGGNSGVGNSAEGDANGPGGESGAGGGGGGSKIICAELHRQGKMPALIFVLDEAFGELMAARDPMALDGYKRLARPVVALMKRSPVFSGVVWAIARPWAEEMACQMGHGSGSAFGRVMMRCGLPVCRLFGRLPAQGVA